MPQTYQITLKFFFTKNSLSVELLLRKITTFWMADVMYMIGLCHTFHYRRNPKQRSFANVFLLVDNIYALISRPFIAPTSSKTHLNTMLGWYLWLNEFTTAENYDTLSKQCQRLFAAFLSSNTLLSQWCCLKGTCCCQPLNLD